MAEAGTYQVKIGASSKDIRLTGNFDLAEDILVKKESLALAPQEPINELRPVK